MMQRQQFQVDISDQCYQCDLYTCYALPLCLICTIYVKKEIFLLGCLSKSNIAPVCDGLLHCCRCVQDLNRAELRLKIYLK